MDYAHLFVKRCLNYKIMDDDGLAKAIDSEIPEDVQESAKEARDGCPVDAIDID